MPRFIRIFIVLAAGLAYAAGCGGTICEDANDLCATTPDAPSFKTERDQCVGDDECLSQCLVEANACDLADLSNCEAVCEGSAGGGAP